MQAVRRSDRIRNRNRNNGRRFLNNQRAIEAAASFPNLHMGGDGNNASLDDNETYEAEVNPNIGDFIPDDQENAILFEDFPRRRIICRSCLLAVLKLFKIISLIFIILLSAELLLPNGYIAKQQIISTILSKNNNYNAENLKSYYILRHSTDKLIKINRQIRHLNRKLQSLSKTLEEIKNWREYVKNETVQMSSNQVDKFNLKLEEALNLYDADKIGITDYALESAGGYILSTPETTPYPSRFSYDVMGIVNIQYPSNPRLLIQPETLPGQCFAFKGRRGRIRIGLAHVIDITAVTLEHAYPNLVDTASAPKDFIVYSLLSANSEDKDELGSFTYRIEKKPLQMFPIDKLHKEKKRCEYVELEIISNHGNPKYTCIYRFRVHGNKLV